MFLPRPRSSNTQHATCNTFPILYEVNARCWLAALSDAAGKQLTLADVPDREFDFWERCGFTHIWLMGVWTVGNRGLAWSKKFYQGRQTEFRCSEVAGSPYAITGYTVTAGLGGDSALAGFRRRLNERGMRLVLDYIPNHTALDHPWARAHPDFYVTSPVKRAGAVRAFRGAPCWYAHGDCGHGAPWVDTLQLDYRSDALRSAMVAELLGIAKRCDGVRCDMAMLALNDVFARTWNGWPSAVPNLSVHTEFWADAITAVKDKTPDFMFLAEVYWDLEQRLQDLGFDYTYDKRLYDRFIAHDAAGVVSYLHSLGAEWMRHSAHFIENHDEPRIASLVSAAEHKAGAVLVAGLPGMRFFHEGQFGAARVHANVHFSRRALEQADASMEEFYRRLFAALRQSSVGQGTFQLLASRPAWEANPSHTNIVLVEWRDGMAATFDLVAINLAATQSQCYAPVELPDFGADSWILSDLLGDASHVRTAVELRERGLYLDLAPHEAQLFHCRPA